MILFEAILVLGFLCCFFTYGMVKAMRAKRVVRPTARTRVRLKPATDLILRARKPTV